MDIAAATRVRAAVAPAVTGHGLDLEDVVVRRAGRRQLVQVVVDRDGGVALDDIAGVSRLVSAALDADPDALPGPYVLEVTSPGVDRPLTEPRHWRRATGRLVKVRSRDGAELVGRVVAAGEAAVTLDVDGSERELSLADVARAQVQVEFTRSNVPGSDDEDGGQA